MKISRSVLSSKSMVIGDLTAKLEGGDKEVIPCNSIGSLTQTASLSEAEDSSKSCSCSATDSSDEDVVSRTVSDPYADVRDRLESLSLHSKLCHVYHTHQISSSSTSEYSEHEPIVQVPETQVEPTITFFAACTTYLGYAVLIFVGHVRNTCSSLFRTGRYRSHQKTNCPSDDATKYATLLKSFENFYTKRLYHRIQDCFNRPLASNPGSSVHVLERISTDGNKTLQVLGPLENVSREDGEEYTNGQHYSTVSEDRVTRKCLNLGSYNYLGFADDWNITCREDVLSSMKNLPISMSSCRMEGGTSQLHEEVEDVVAKFVNKEAALVMNMGFNTNATTIPALMGRGDLIVSDELNHTSIVNGARKSGSAIRCFRHNDSKHLEEILKEAIVMGQPRTRRAWKKIMVIVEGIYSMEGEYCDLPSVIKVCKQYGAYVYVDEAHSIGAMGESGRGVCEYCGVDTKDVDIMMGTFTKSFGGMGGYVAGNKDIIDCLRSKCAASSYHNSLSPVICQQVISSFKVSFEKHKTRYNLHLGVKDTCLTIVFLC